MPQALDIWVKYTECDLGKTVQGSVPSFPVLSSSWTPPNQILSFQKPLPTGKKILTYAKWSKKTQQWVIHSQAKECVVLIPTKYKDPHGLANCIDEFIIDVKQRDMMNIVPLRGIVEPPHWVQENAT